MDESELIGAFQRGRKDEGGVGDPSFARFFPEEKPPRPGQLEAVQQIVAAFESGKKFVLFEGGTGMGKTVVAVAVARYYQQAYYLCYEKYLQDQFFEEFGTTEEERHPDKFVMLKGRKAYECRFDDLDESLRNPNWIDVVDRPLTCDSGVCTFNGKYAFEACMKEKICRYYNAKEVAGIHPYSLLNYHVAYWNMHRGEWLPHRKLMIIDEAHNLESVGRSLAKFAINNRFIDAPFPEFKSVDECLAFLEENKWEKRLKDVEEWAYAERDSQSLRWAFYQQAVYQMMRGWTQYERDSTIVKTETDKDVDYVNMKPCDVGGFLNRSFYDHADRVLVMSATLLSRHHACKELGIDEANCAWISKPSNFPVKNRPIFICPSGSMSFNEKHNTLPTMAADVNTICQFFPDQRIVVHTHTHANADYLKERLPFPVTRRFFDRTTAFEREKVVEAFMQSKNGILVGPRFYEGLDLKYDVARVQIMMKVPYLNFKEDPVVERKMKMPGGDKWYAYQTAKIVCQLAGRVVRAMDDWGYTFILDAGFVQFRSRNMPMLFPPYIDEALVWCMQGPVSEIGMPSYDWRE